MKRAVLLVFFIGVIASAQENRYVHGAYEFQVGSVEYLFGDNVKLRTAPDTNSEVVQLLAIASPLKILEKTKELTPFNGYDSPWYKVNANGKEGYVLGGLIALVSQSIDDERYLAVLKKKDEEQFINTRLVKADAPYQELSVKLSGSASGVFRLKTFTNRGLPNVANMVQLDLTSEACGVEGGGIYLFNDGSNFFKAFEYSQISDAGVYWYNENYIFPEDENGVPGKFIYEEEIGSYQDEETNWVEIKKTQRELEWKNGKLTPDLKAESK